MFKKFKILISSMFLALSSVGFSSWVFLGSAEDSNIKYSEDSALKAVAYIKSNSTVKYTSIEKAVEVANLATSREEVVVIPGTNPTITRNLTINANVTLSLPYIDSTYWEGDNNQKGVTTYEDSFINEATYKKLEVFVSSNVNIINYGSINIGGVQSGGGGGKNKSGQTGGDYAQLSLQGNTSINCYGSFNCYGYLRGFNENNKATFYSGSLVNTLFAIREHRGGTILSNIKDNMQSSPFNRFYIANIMDLDFRFESGSKLYSIADLYTGAKLIFSAQHNRTSVNMIGSDNSSLVNLSDGTNLSGNFSSSTYISNIVINGSFKLNALILSLSLPFFETVSLSTSSVLFPLSWYQKITLNSFENGNSATVDATSQGVKVLPGSSIIINENVIVNANDLAIYDTFIDSTSGTGLAVAYEKDGHNEPGEFIVNGKFISSGSYGGEVVTTSNSSSLDINTANIDTYELSNGDPVTYTTTNRVAKAYVDSSSNLVSLEDASRYNGKGSYFVKNVIPTHKITFTVNGNGDTNYEDASFDYEMVLTYEGETKTLHITNTENTAVTVNEGTTYVINAITPAQSISTTSGTIGSNDVEITIQCLKGSKIYTISTTYTDNKDDSDAIETKPVLSILIKDGVTGATSQTTITADGSISIRENSTIVITETSTKGTDEQITLTHGTTSFNLGDSIVVTNNITIAIMYDGTAKSCIIEGTLITMGDGTYKKVEDIVSGDIVQVFNHETGQVDTSHIVFNEKNEKNNFEVMECHFEDSLVEVIYEHAFFDINLNKYVYINKETINDFIGDDFVMIDNGIVKSSKLLNINVVNKNTCVYGPTTYKELNFINNNMLSIGGNISGLFNIFEYEKDTLKYDPIKKQQDIDLYGLLTLEDYQGLISEYMFEAFNGAYLGIAVGKGLITWEGIHYLAELYGPLC